MKKFGTIWAIVFILGSSIAVAQDHAPAPLLPDRISFISPPGLSGVQVAQLLGDPKQPTPYLIRVKLAAGAQFRLTPTPMPAAARCWRERSMSDSAKPSWNRKSSPCRRAGFTWRRRVFRITSGRKTVR